LEEGVAPPQARKKWFDFTHYVPLALNTPPSMSMGNHELGYIANPTRTDYVRFGYKKGTQTAGALSLMHRYVENAALEIGSRDYVHLLFQMIQRQKKLGRKHGLIAVKLNDKGQAAASHSQRQIIAANNPGWLYRDWIKLPDGSYKEVLYKLTFLLISKPVNLRICCILLISLMSCPLALSSFSAQSSS
jgi:hypothetical protein